MENLKSITSLLQETKEVEFTEQDHRYMYQNRPMTSVTTLIKQYTNKFDEEYWSRYTALKRMGYRLYPGRKGETVFLNHTEYDIQNYAEFTNINHKDILKEWREKGQNARKKGTAVHSYLENAVWGKYNTRRSVLLDSVVRDIKEQFTPLFTEFIVLHPEYDLIGTIDLVCLEENNDVVLIDFKTDEEIQTENKYDKMLGPLSDLDDCSFNKYTVQLNLYRTFLERFLGVSKMYVIHIQQESYDWYEVPRIETKELIHDYNRKRTVHLQGTD